jgi:hypothetical protein
LWKLSWFAPNFYQSFAICYSHLELHGNWPRHARYLAIKYGENMWKGTISTDYYIYIFTIEVNKRFYNAKKYPTLLPLKEVFVLLNSKTEGKKIKLKHLTFEQMQSFVQQSIIFLKGYIIFFD